MSLIAYCLLQLHQVAKPKVFHCFEIKNYLLHIVNCSFFKPLLLISPYFVDSEKSFKFLLKKLYFLLFPRQAKKQLFH